MKEMIEKLLGEKTGELTKVLEKRAGFSTEEAGKFLPGVLDKLKGLLGDGKLDLSDLTDLSGLKSKFDLPALASQAGIDEAKADQGVQAVIGKVGRMVEKETGSFGGLLGQAGKLFGK